MTPLDQSYCEIPLTQGQVTRVSREDFEKYGKFNWYALWNPKTQSFYAVRNVPKEGGGQTNQLLHREILGLKRGDKIQGDHALHNTLDNRRFVDGKENLRIATPGQNRRNCRVARNNKCGYKGVYFDKKAKKETPWRAVLRTNGKMIVIGYFATPELAYAAYCAKAIGIFGEFAWTPQVRKEAA